MEIRTQIKPIFLLSLPRSGSTLLQRILATHAQIATSAEPWLLLPLVYSTRSRGIVAEYNQIDCVAAIEDFLAGMSSDIQSYWRELRLLMLALYKQVATRNEDYFLDKTPRYHLIIDELQQIFPDAKFVILWRNPLAVAASMMETWSGGKWNIHRFEIDLYDGLLGLVRAKKTANEKFYSIKFENFVADPHYEYTQLLEFLDLEVDLSGLDSFVNVKLDGRMGDPTGINQYQSIDSSGNEKWLNTLKNPWRKYWSHRYIDEIGAEALATMGYSAQALHEEIRSTSIHIRFLFSDLARVAYRKLSPITERKCRRWH